MGLFDEVVPVDLRISFFLASCFFWVQISEKYQFQKKKKKYCYEYKKGIKKVSPKLKILTVSYKDIPILVMPKLKGFVPTEVAFKLILFVTFLVKVCIKFRIVTYTKYVYHSGNQEAFVF